MSVPLCAETAPFALSKLTVDKGHATKKLVEDSHGHPRRPPGQDLSISTGTVEHVRVEGLHGLSTLLQEMTPKQCLIHGAVTGTEPGALTALVTAAQLAKHPGAVARTLDFFAYPQPVFLLMFDVDPDPHATMQMHGAPELMAQLAAIFPAFTGAGWVSVSSTSSSIKSKKTQEWLVPPGGFHCYVLATGSVERWRELARVRLWLAGTGWCKLARPNAHTGISSILERCLVDLAVWSPERVDFVAGALIAKNAPFFQERPAPDIQAGAVVDLDAICDLTDDERQQYQALVAEARARLAPERTRLVRDHITTAAPELTDEAIEAEVSARLERAERGELTHDHPLRFDNGKTVLAGKVTANMDEWTLADPVEPEEGRGKAKLYWNGGRWCISSWAHGALRTYRLALPVSPGLGQDDLQDLLVRTDEATARAHTTPVSPQQARFRVNEHGVWFRPPLDELGNQPEDVWVCDELRIVAATFDTDHDNHGHLLEFRDKHGHPQQWSMPLSLLEDQREYRKVLRRLGLRMNSAAKALLQHYLDVWQTQVLARCVDRVGWHQNAYVLPDITLGDTGGERLVLQSLDHKSEGYRQAGTLESWQQAIAAPCVGNSRLLVAVSTAFAAPLLELMGEESGGLHFRGASSTGKTTVVYAAATVWGEPTRLEQWRATANALEGVALAHNDCLLCLDDLKEIDPREAGTAAYMLCNGAGKRRGQPHGGTRARLTWRLLFLSTGELSLEQHIADAGHRIYAGQEVRLVDIPAEAGAGLGLFEDLHGAVNGQAFADHLREETKQHYGHAGRAFVSALAQDRPGRTAQVRSVMDVFVAQQVPAGAAGQVYRVAQRFALIGAAGELATVFELAGWPSGMAIEAAARCFQDWLMQRGGVGNAEETRALAQVRLFFEQYGASRFLPWTLDDGATCQRCNGTGQVGYAYMQGLCFTCNGTGKITPDHPALRLVQSRAGWSKATDDGRTEFYVLPEVFRKEIAKGFDVPGLCRSLGAHGYLLASAQGKWLRSERIPGLGKTSAYRITADLLGIYTCQGDEKISHAYE